MPRISKVLKKLLTTEKTTKLKESQNKYVFEVLLGATANSVVKEIEEKYKVDVVDIQSLVLPGKKRRVFRTQRFARLPKWKKVIVKIKDGQKIEETTKDKSNKTTKVEKSKEDLKDKEKK